METFEHTSMQVFARLIGEKDLLLSFANGSPLPTSVHANKTRLALFAFNQSPEQVHELYQHPSHSSLQCKSGYLLVQASNEGIC